ncbi:YitT family protein [Streptococcus sp. X16XC17]|uniref:YitT family protein n=1 Tax=unclassified Streptococcus TaxID=2608887 RepID=UPI00066FC0D0|nr:MULTISPECIES: YitT family protein [unclassified Streptococcus]TCD45476.1 YitT family protein [Streptococcus sp. X16XC17]
MNNKLKDYAFVTLGALIAAIGFNTMFVENNIASGGVGGLAISMKALLGWNPSNFVLFANVPLLILCWVLLGRSTLIRTLYGAWIYPVFISLTDMLPTFTHNPLLAAIFGGVILGFGIGLVFLGNSSTGGTGIVVQILNKYTPISLGILIGIIDGIIVVIGFVAFDPDTVMYSIIALLCITYITNLMMAGSDSSRNMLIISKKHVAIKEYITKIADRGVTELPVVGGYTGSEKRMLMTTVSRQEVQIIEQEIISIDETAFMVIMPATQVRGRGFSLHKDHSHIDDDILIPM